MKLDRARKFEFMVIINSDDEWEVEITISKQGNAATRARECMMLKEHIDMALSKIQALRAAEEGA